MDTEVRNKLTNRIRAAVRLAHNATTAFSSSAPSSPTTPTTPTTPVAGSVNQDPNHLRTSLGDTVLPSTAHEHDAVSAGKKLTPTISNLAPAESVPPPPKDTKIQDHTELPSRRGEPVVLTIDGQRVEIKSQIHLYAMCVSSSIESLWRACRMGIHRMTGIIKWATHLSLPL